MSLIRCEDLSFAYDGVTVLSGLNFNIEQGNYLCIIGENGAGKSTLMKGLLGLKKPSTGSVVFGEGLTATEIGYLPQQTPVQKDFPASVGEVVLSGCISGMGLRPFFTKAERERAARNMEMMEITDLKNQCYRDLSGGQQQRVLLSRALCATKKVILLDEPAAGLDPLVTVNLYKMIERINKEMGITVIMVSHDLRAAVGYASHILHLGEDRQLFFGTVREYRHSASYHKFAGDNAVRIWRKGSDNEETRRHRAAKNAKKQPSTEDKDLYGDEEGIPGIRPGSPIPEKRKRSGKTGSPRKEKEAGGPADPGRQQAGEHGSHRNEKEAGGPADLGRQRQAGETDRTEEAPKDSGN